MKFLRITAAVCAVILAFSAVSCGRKSGSSKGKKHKETAADAPVIADIEPDADFDSITSTLTFTDQDVDRELIEELCDPSDLETLVIEGGSFDASELDGDFDSLAVVDISRCQLTGFEMLAELPALTDLRAAYSGVTSMTCLDGKEQLRSLDLSGSRLDLTAALPTLTGLEELALNSMGLSSLAPIGGLTSLKALFIANNSLTSLDECAALPSLRILAFDNNNVTDLSPLADLSHIEYFSGADNGFESIEPLRASSNALVWAAFDNSSVTDLSPLEYAYNLRYLSASGCKVDSLKPLNGKFSLGYLDLSDCGLTDFDLSEEGSPKNLKSVFLDGNSLTDPTQMTALSSAEIISASCNLFTGSLTLPAGGNSLKLLDISGCPVSAILPDGNGDGSVHALALVGCPIEEYGKDICGYGTLWYSGADTLDMSGLTRSNFSEIYLADCPEEAFTEVTQTLSESCPKAEITNVSAADALKMVYDKKALMKAEILSGFTALGNRYEPSKLSDISDIEPDEDDIAE